MFRTPTWFTLVFSVLLATLPIHTAEADTSVKGAIIVSPSEVDISNRWFVSFALDSPLNLNETFFWGIEIQSAFYSVTAGNETATVVPLNGFLNIKAKSDKFNARPYAGFGFGMATFFATEGENTTWNRQLGLHFLGGVELGSFAVEFMAQRRLESGARFNYSILFGLHW